MLKNALQEFLDSVAWKDQLKHDPDDDTDYVRTGYGIDGRRYDLVLAADEANQSLKISLLSPFMMPAKRRTNAALVITALNQSLAIGAFFMNSDGEVYYYDVLDVEGAGASPKQFENMLAAGGGAFSELRCVALGAAAYTKQSGEEIIADFEQSIRTASEAAQEPAASDVPESL